MQHFLIWWAILIGVVYLVFYILDGIAQSRSSGVLPEAEFPWWTALIGNAIIAALILLVIYGIGAVFT